MDKSKIGFRKINILLLVFASITKVGLIKLTGDVNSSTHNQQFGTLTQQHPHTHSFQTLTRPAPPKRATHWMGTKSP